jgi:hypothetical protein
MSWNLRRVTGRIAATIAVAAAVLMSSGTAHADPELWKFYNRYGSTDACWDAGQALEAWHPHIWQWKCQAMAVGGNPTDLYYRGTI